MSINVDLSSDIVKPPKGYRVYKIKGVENPIIAKKGGPTADQIKNKASYAELRKNQKEFGVASMMAKVLRNSLTEEMSELCETYVSGKLTAQFRNLAKHEPGKTGTRPLYLSKHGHNLTGFEFNSNHPYEQTFDAKYHIQKGSHRGHIILHFPSFVPERAFEAPKEATNFKITASLIVLSDYEYSNELSSYFPQHEEAHGKYGSYESQMLPMLKMPTEPITAQISANEGRPVPENTGIFLVMAVRFYKYSNGKFEHLKREGAMQIKQVF